MTKERFETITLDLSEEEQLSAIDAYVTSTLSNPAKETFAVEVANSLNQGFSPTDSVKHALYHAVLNELILKALTRVVEDSQEVIVDEQPSN